MSCCPECPETGGDCSGLGAHMHDRSQYNVVSGYGLNGLSGRSVMGGLGFDLPSGVAPPPQAEYAPGPVAIDPSLYDSRPTFAFEPSPVPAFTWGNPLVPGPGQLANRSQDDRGFDLGLPEIPTMLWVGLGVFGIAIFMRRGRR